MSCVRLLLALVVKGVHIGPYPENAFPKEFFFWSNMLQIKTTPNYHHVCCLFVCLFVCLFFFFGFVLFCFCFCVCFCFLMSYTCIFIKFTWYYLQPSTIKAHKICLTLFLSCVVLSVVKEGPILTRVHRNTWHDIFKINVGRCFCGNFGLDLWSRALGLYGPRLFVIWSFFEVKYAPGPYLKCTQLKEHVCYMLLEQYIFKNGPGVYLT